MPSGLRNQVDMLSIYYHKMDLYTKELRKNCGVIIAAADIGHFTTKMVKNYFFTQRSTLLINCKAKFQCFKFLKAMQLDTTTRSNSILT